MARIKRGVTARARHKKLLGRAKGYYGARSRVFRVAKQTLIKASHYAYRDRKVRKRQFRRLWITRINAEAKRLGLSYNTLISGLKRISIAMDRKILAELAVNDKTLFAALVEQIVKQGRDNTCGQPIVAT
ncbi:MAG: 50S ribosomal protein L20 [Gammaproteobacteria bacterium]|nr:50S ribosomal protein L20 [Gammaproteobacteria bacterium]